MAECETLEQIFYLLLRMLGRNLETLVSGPNEVPRELTIRARKALSSCYSAVIDC